MPGIGKIALHVRCFSLGVTFLPIKWAAASADEMFVEPFAAARDVCLRFPQPHKPIQKPPLPQAGVSLSCF